MAKIPSKAARAPSAAASVKVSVAPKKVTTRRSSSKQIDPAIKRAVSGDNAQRPLTVMIKFDTQASEFGKRPVSNRPGSARERAFTQEVEALVHDCSAPNVRVLTAAANLGVATVQASAAVIKSILQSPKVTGAKLKAS